MNIEALKLQLIPEEGLRLKPYCDSVGKITIGVGHNLTDNGISAAVCDAILIEDILSTVSDLNTHLPWWQALDEVRQRVLADLCFNMGVSTLLTFTTFLAFLKAGQYESAAADLATTKWYQQVGSRGPKLVSMLVSGKEPA